jgi:hypothetical protein
MKTKLKTLSRSLIKLHLLKYQMYETCKTTTFNNYIQNLTFEIKQSLKVVHLYNKKNKKILFVGFTYKKALHNQLNHSFLSKRLYTKNFLSGKSDLSNILPNTKPDLIVFNQLSTNDSHIIKKLEKQGITYISLGTSKVKHSKFYSVNNFYKTPQIKKFYFFLVFSVLTRQIK